MKALVDTNVLVYRFDPRDSVKQAVAHDLLRSGAKAASLCLPHQAIVEFVRATTRPLGRDLPALLTKEQALQEAENLLVAFEILYPTEAVLRTALRGAAAYRLNWFDAHLWAYADAYGLDEILSEDFADGHLIGGVRVRDPFKMELHAPRAAYGRRGAKNR